MKKKIFISGTHLRTELEAAEQHVRDAMDGECVITHRCTVYDHDQTNEFDEIKKELLRSVLDADLVLTIDYPDDCSHTPMERNLARYCGIEVVPLVNYLNKLKKAG